MKSRTIQVTVLVVVVLSLAGPMQAQMAIKEPLARVDVPFAFSAGGMHLPAGNYHISHPGHPYFVLIEKDDGRARALVYVHPSTVNSSGPTKLVFNKYGDQYFLSQIWTEPDQDMHKCYQSSQEKDLMVKADKPESVAIAAKR
jgi:hypothetical protein